MTGYSAIFWDSVKCSQEYAEALDVVRWNSEGRVWVVGGFLYKTIANAIYKTEQRVFNIDFIVDKVPDSIIPVNGWVRETNKYNGLRFRHGVHTVDITELEKINSIVRRGVKPSIENYLSGVPLSVQSLAYDLGARSIAGNSGMAALETRTVSINDIVEAEISAQKKGITVPELVQTTARTLNFTPII